MSLLLLLGTSTTSSETPDFDYTTIPGLLAEFNATAGVTDSGGHVTTWTDQINSYTYTAAGSARPQTGVRTVNGKNFLEFDGVANTMTGSSALYGVGAANNTIVDVYISDDTVTNQRLMSGNVGADVRLESYLEFFSNRIAANNRASYGPARLTVTPDTNVHAVIRHRNGTTLSLYQDGGIPATTTSFNVTCDNLHLGSSGTGGQFFNGGFGLQLIWPRALTTAELNTLGNGLATNFGITWTTIT